MGKSRAKVSINVALGRRYVLSKVVAGVKLAAQEGENMLIDTLSLPPTRTGKHYKGNPNKSSAPGEPPAPQSGVYRQGVVHTPPEIRGQTVRASVGSRGAQARKLEFGDEHVQPRPHVSLLRDDPQKRARLLAAFKIGAERK